MIAGLVDLSMVMLGRLNTSYDQIAWLQSGEAWDNQVLLQWQSQKNATQIPAIPGIVPDN
jgi:hypothetical protein